MPLSPKASLDGEGTQDGPPGPRTSVSCASGSGHTSRSSCFREPALHHADGLSRDSDFTVRRLKSKNSGLLFPLHQEVLDPAKWLRTQQSISKDPGAFLF